MPHFFFRSWKDEEFLREIQIFISSIIVSWMSISRGKYRTKTTIKKTEEKVQITKEEEKSIQDIIETFVRTTNEKNLAEHMELFSKKMPSAEDIKAQIEAAFQKGNKKIELEHLDMKASKAGYVIVETKEKETNGEVTLQKKVQYALGKEDEKWKIEEVRTIEKK